MAVAFAGRVGPRAMRIFRQDWVTLLTSRGERIAMPVLLVQERVVLTTLLILNGVFQLLNQAALRGAKSARCGCRGLCRL